MEAHSQYSENVRYQLAKQQLEQAFLKWISQDNVYSFVNKLIEEVHDPTNNILSPPAPIFVNKIATPLSPSSKGTPNSGITAAAFGHTPPRSPCGNEGYRTLKNPVFEPIDNKEEEKDFASRTLSRKELTTELKKQKIPKFYFKDGPPLPAEVAEENKKEIDAAFGANSTLSLEGFVPI